MHYVTRLKVHKIRGHNPKTTQHVVRENIIGGNRLVIIWFIGSVVHTSK